MFLKNLPYKHKCFGKICLVLVWISSKMFEECLGLLYDMIDYVCDTFGYVWICLEMYENVQKDLHLLG